MFFDAVGYGDLAPTSEELQQMAGCDQKEERNQCAPLHLAAASTRAAVNSNRSPPPGSRVRLMAKGLRLLGSMRALVAKEYLRLPVSQWATSC